MNKIDYRVWGSSFFISILCIGLAGLMLQPIIDQKLRSDEKMSFEIHCEVWVYRMGELVFYAHHPATVTNQGLDWAEDQLGDSPSTDPAKWIGLDDTQDTPLVTWTDLPSEYTGDGLDRAAGTYASTGTGTWNITRSFSPTASVAIELIGLYYESSGTTLFCADDIDTTNVANGDTLQVRFSLEIS